MNNAEKFQEVFGYYATEMWAKSEKEFLDWINAGYNTTIKTNERTGEWKHTMTYYPYCSECEWMPEEDEMTHGRYSYCPNCGARMKGDEE